MDLRLIYVNKIGYNHRGRCMYEFLFMDVDNGEKDDVWGEGWEETPALGSAQPPSEEHISAVLEMSLTEYELCVIGENEHYSVYDSVQGIIAMAYEMVDDDYPYDERLVFHFGDSLEDIKNILKTRKIKFTIDEL